MDRFIVNKFISLKTIEDYDRIMKFLNWVLHNLLDKTILFWVFHKFELYFMVVWMICNSLDNFMIVEFFRAVFKDFSNFLHHFIQSKLTLHDTNGAVLVKMIQNQWWPTHVPRHTNVPPNFFECHEPHAVHGFGHGLLSKCAAAQKRLAISVQNHQKLSNVR